MQATHAAKLRQQINSLMHAFSSIIGIQGGLGGSGGSGGSNVWKAVDDVCRTWTMVKAHLRRPVYVQLIAVDLELES